MLESAQKAGFAFVKLIHGAPDVRHPKQAQHGRRGGIKWALGSHLYRGDWSHIVYPGRSVLHRIEDGAMVVALRQQESHCADRSLPA